MFARGFAVCRAYPTPPDEAKGWLLAFLRRYALHLPGGTTESANDRPRISSRFQPKVISACAFQSMTLPAASMATKASFAVSMISRVRC